MRERDPRDRHYPERLTASYILSLILHALVALLLFSIASSSSQEGATQDVAGGEIVTFSKVVARVQPAVASPHPPVPAAPTIAPLRHAPAVLPATQPVPPRPRELSAIATNAPPLPKPLPQASLAPNPVATRAVVEPSPAPQIPAVPVPVASAAIATVVVKVPPSAAPSPKPSAQPTIAPTVAPRPTVAPTHAPPTAAPAPVPTAVRATPAPPSVQATIAPAKTAGVPSPTPTNAPAITKAAGTAPTPGPKGIASPGPRAGAPTTTHPAPSRPINVTPTASPAPPARPASPAKPGRDMNAFLRSLLPNNPVAVGNKTYGGGYRDVPTSLDPTPPPGVLAVTKYIFESHGSGNEARTKMWVTSIRKVGFVTMCRGWLVSFPIPTTMEGVKTPGLGANGTQITIGGGRNHGTLSPFESGYKPIIEPNAEYVCDARSLSPFVPSPAP